MKKAAPFLLLLGAFAALRPVAPAQSTSGVKSSFYPQVNTGASAQVQHPELLFPASAGEEEPREVCANAEGIAWVTITDPPTVAVYSQFGAFLQILQEHIPLRLLLQMVVPVMPLLPFHNLEYHTITRIMGLPFTKI